MINMLPTATNAVEPKREMLRDLLFIFIRSAVSAPTDKVADTCHPVPRKIPKMSLPDAALAIKLTIAILTARKDQTSSNR